MPNDLSREGAEFLKEFAEAGASGKLWLCNLYRGAVLVGKAVIGASAVIGAIATVWHIFRGQ